MEFLPEIALNMTGFLVGLAIGAMSLAGFRNTGSPTLFRLSIAFLSVSSGFLVIWAGYALSDPAEWPGGIDRRVQTLGIGLQTVGYFFIAFSHSIKSFFPKNRHLRSVGFLPLLAVSAIHVEHMLRATSFILLVYGAIETMMSYAASRKRGAALVALGLGLLAFGEFLEWYSFVFPERVLYYVSVSAKVAGLASLFVPVSRVPLRGVRLGGGGA